MDLKPFEDNARRARKSVRRSAMAAGVAGAALVFSLVTACNPGSDDDCELLGQAVSIELSGAATKGGGGKGPSGKGPSGTSIHINGSDCEDDD